MPETKHYPYEFVALAANGQSVQIDIRPHDDSAQKHYLKVWQKMSSALSYHYEIFNLPHCPAWTKWLPGEWCKQKIGYEGRLQVVAWVGDNLVGFLNVWNDFPSPHEAGLKVLYIEHLGAFPGDISTEIWHRRFSGVGTALLAYAVLMSKKQGFDGRFGLHVASDEGMGFYRRVESKLCRSGLFKKEMTGVAGPTKRGESELPKTYLESEVAGSSLLLEEYRNG